MPYSLTLELGKFAERKIEAFRKHSSQVVILDRVGDVLRKHLGVERYLLAAAPGQIGVTADLGLFAGVVAD